jgi:hypothetical protein
MLRMIYWLDFFFFFNECYLLVYLRLCLLPSFCERKYYAKSNTFFFFFFLIVMIEFKPMASAYNGCSYHQVKTPIDFWCRRDLNPGPLLDDKRLPTKFFFDSYDRI